MAVAVAVGLLVIALAVGGWFVGKYNTMVELRSGTAGYEKTWADVESQYQRRADALEYADLRYPDGYALRLKGVTTVSRERALQLSRDAAAREKKKTRTTEGRN